MSDGVFFCRKLSSGSLALSTTFDDEDGRFARKHSLGGDFVITTFCGCVHRKAGREHDVDRDEQRDAVEHLVGGRLLDAESVTEKGEDDDDFRERGEEHDRKGKKRKPRQDGEFGDQCWVVYIGSERLGWKVVV